MLRPLRLPCLLVGDPHLGGISATLSAYDSLTLRGYDVDVVLLLEPPPPEPSRLAGGSGPVDPPLDNASAIRRHLDKAVHRLGARTEVVSMPGCRPPPAPLPGEEKAHVRSEAPQQLHVAACSGLAGCCGQTVV